MTSVIIVNFGNYKFSVGPGLQSSHIYNFYFLHYILDNTRFKTPILKQGGRDGSTRRRNGGQ